MSVSRCHHYQSGQIRIQPEAGSQPCASPPNPYHGYIYPVPDQICPYRQLPSQYGPTPAALTPYLQRQEDPDRVVLPRVIARRNHRAGDIVHFTRSHYFTEATVLVVNIEGALTNSRGNHACTEEPKPALSREHRVLIVDESANCLIIHKY